MLGQSELRILPECNEGCANPVRAAPAPLFSAEYLGQMGWRPPLRLAVLVSEVIIRSN